EGQSFGYNGSIKRDQSVFLYEGETLHREEVLVSRSNLEGTVSVTSLDEAGKITGYDLLIKSFGIKVNNQEIIVYPVDTTIECRSEDGQLVFTVEGEPAKDMAANLLLAFNLTGLNDQLTDSFYAPEEPLAVGATWNYPAEALAKHFSSDTVNIAPDKTEGFIMIDRVRETESGDAVRVMGKISLDDYMPKNVPAGFKIDEGMLDIRFEQVRLVGNSPGPLSRGISYQVSMKGTREEEGETYDASSLMIENRAETFNYETNP
ncbi:MAG: hypothetical protein AAGA45_06025, partial [Verrucomicrobiota bacterium]